jgi:Tn3 transposase DDE domain
LAPLFGQRLNRELIATYWDDIGRVIEAIRNRTVTPSLILKKLSGYRQRMGLPRHCARSVASSVRGVDASAAAPERIQHAAEIAAIEEDDRGDDQVECSSAARLVLMAAVAETAEAMQGGRAAEGVECLALVELGRD